MYRGQSECTGDGQFFNYAEPDSADQSLQRTFRFGKPCENVRVLHKVIGTMRKS
jgi:hypothetical protein